MAEIETAVPSKSKREYKKRAPASSQGVDIAALLALPEVQNIIAAAVAAAGAERGGNGGRADDKDDLSVIRSLAAEISTLNNQGNKQRRFTAEEMEQHKAGRDRLDGLLTEVKERGLAPEYYVNRITYLNEELVFPTFVDPNKVQRRTRIAWRGVPNEAMEPVEGSEIAHEIFAAFVQSIGGRTPHAHRANYTVDGKTVKESELVVLHKGLQQRETHPVGRARGGVEHLGRHMPGQIVETAVLGTIAQPARQTA